MSVAVAFGVASASEAESTGTLTVMGLTGGVVPSVSGYVTTTRKLTVVPGAMFVSCGYWLPSAGFVTSGRGLPLAITDCP